MPLRFWIAAILACGAAALARAGEFPYTAYVNSGDVYVRSGPGRNYYPTDKLQKGEKVEVYRHDPGGWYAIRPTRGSFCWVSTRHIDISGDGIGVINSPRTVARVGSTLSEVREVIQVRLEKGEKVEVLQPPTPDSPWVKIAPPAGEFRWVFAKFVEREMPADVAADEREAYGDAPTAQQASATAPSAPVGEVGAGTASAESIVQRELDHLDVELAAIVAGDPATWQLDALQPRAEQLLQDAQTPAQRGRARMALKKLAQFKDIKDRQASIQNGQVALDAQAVAAAKRKPIDPRFDGIGRLSPVISQRTGAPQYALVDGANTVVSFVTPAPGVNLRPYVNKNVGVNGQRGYMSDLGRQHINVQRVTLLDVERR